MIFKWQVGLDTHTFLITYTQNFIILFLKFILSYILIHYCSIFWAVKLILYLKIIPLSVPLCTYETGKMKT